MDMSGGMQKLAALWQTSSVVSMTSRDLSKSSTGIGRSGARGSAHRPREADKILFLSTIPMKRRLEKLRITIELW
jgi:hypothetical protein